MGGDNTEFMWTEVIKVSSGSTMTDWLKHSLLLQLENHHQEIDSLLFFSPLLSDEKQTNLSDSKARGESLKSWASAESILSASMTCGWWLIEGYVHGIIPWEWRTAHPEQKTHISTVLFSKRKKTQKTHSSHWSKFLKRSSLLNASTALDRPQWLRILFFFVVVDFFFFLLNEKWH